VMIEASLPICSQHLLRRTLSDSRPPRLIQELALLPSLIRTTPRENPSAIRLSVNKG
jgi:hypothetical protein